MPEGKRRKILVVDDNATFLEMVPLVLGEDFEVFAAQDGAQGLELARRELPEAILLDVMMPRVSGVEMLRELQADLETRRIPVVVLTASTLDRSTAEMIEREVNVKAFLRKPCGAQKLRDQVRLALRDPEP